MLRIEALEIDDHILAKIESRHGVQFDELEQTCYSVRRHVRQGREVLYKVFGHTDSGRFLLVVLADRGAGLWRVPTARSMTPRNDACIERWWVNGYG